MITQHEKTPDWFNSSLGRALLEQERDACAKLAPSGYYPRGLQAGGAAVDFLGGIECGERFFIGGTEECAARAANGGGAHCALADAAAMPFGGRSQDLIVLPHTLDCSDNPRAVLREASQVLTPQGCLVITGFNPWSLWGAAWLPAKYLKRGTPPRRYCRLGRVQDWLELLGFELAGARMLAYRPPLQNEKWRGKFAWLDKAGARWWPGLGAVYVLVGRKREIALDGRGDARLEWRRLLPGMAQPAAQRAAPAVSRAARGRD